MARIAVPGGGGRSRRAGRESGGKLSAYVALYRSVERNTHLSVCMEEGRERRELTLKQDERVRRCSSIL